MNSIWSERKREAFFFNSLRF